MMDKLRCMEVLIAVVECGSFSAAATKLSISAVMVGKYIAQLEQQLGMRLIERTTRKQALTSAGISYFAQCKQILEQVRAAESSLESLQQQARGVLRVSAPVNLGSTFIAPLIADYLRQYPLVQLELLLSNTRVDLIEDGFDLAIRTGALRDDSVVARPLLNYRMQMCASPAYLAENGTPQHPAELLQHHVLTHLVWGQRNEWPHLALADGLVWPCKSRFATNDSQALRQAALHGAGIVFQPAVVLADDVRRGDLLPILEGFLPAAQAVHLIYLPNARPRPTLNSLVEFLLAAQRT